MSKWLSKYKEIYQGWINDAFPTPEILALAEPRAEICSSCTLNIKNTCDSSAKGIAVKTFEYYEELRHESKEYEGCGCPLSKKTKSPTSKCPLGKW